MPGRSSVSQLNVPSSARVTRTHTRGHVLISCLCLRLLIYRYQIGSAVIIDPKSEFADIRDTVTPEMKQAVIHFRRLMNGEEDEPEAKAPSNSGGSFGTDVNERQFLITESIDFVLGLEEDEVCAE